MEDSAIVLAAVVTAVMGMLGLYMVSKGMVAGSQVYGTSSNVIKGNLVSVRNSGKLQILTVAEERNRTVISFEPTNFSRFIGKNVKITAQFQESGSSGSIATKIVVEDER